MTVVAASAVVELGPYVVPGVFALLGVWVGKYWEGRSSVRSWRRDRRVAAYGRFLDVLTEARTASIEAAASRDPEKRLDAFRRLRAAVHHSFVTSENEIRLLGPEDVANATAAVVGAYESLTQVVVENVNETDRERRGAAVTAAMKETTGPEVAFLDAARRALR